MLQDKTMGTMIEINVGDIITAKKQHPCGSDEWIVLRTGADIRLQCAGCGHILMLPRSRVNGMIKRIRTKN